MLQIIRSALRDTEKTLYFCNAHPNLFSQESCKQCGRGMCHTCIHNHEGTCPDCLTHSFLGSEAYASGKQMKYILLTGLITLILFVAIRFFNKNGFEIDTSFYNYSLLAFLFGLSLASTYYMMQDTDFLDEIRKIPFIGFKLALVTLVLIFISGTPILYFIYKLFKIKRADSKTLRPKRT